MNNFKSIESCHRLKFYQEFYVNAQLKKMNLTKHNDEQELSSAR